MSNGIIGFPRWTEQVTFSSTGTWEADYPVTNLGIFPFSNVARSVDASLANTKFRGAFADIRKVELLVLCRHNLGLDAQYRVKLFSDTAFTTLLYDSTWLPVWEEVYTENQVDWDGGNWWDRKYTEAERAGTPWNPPLFIDGEYYAGSFTVEIDDTTNADGYVQIGLCEVAQSIEFSRNYGYGSSYGFKDRNIVSEADGGVEYIEERKKPRIFSGSIAFIERDNALGQLFELQRQNGTKIPFFWWPNREDRLHTIRNAYMARLESLDPLTMVAHNWDSVPLKHKEIL